LREVVTNVLDSMRPMATDHELRIQLPKTPLEVVGDRAKVETIVVNLVDNAVKYSPEGGKITCDLTSEAGTAILTVSDTGNGIAPEDMGILFTRFGRGSHRGTSSTASTGPGLSPSREPARRQPGAPGAQRGRA